MRNLDIFEIESTYQRWSMLLFHDYLQGLVRLFAEATFIGDILWYDSKY